MEKIFNKTFDVLNGIIVFLSQIQKYNAALDAIDEIRLNECIPIDSNRFMKIAIEALEQQCIAEVSKLTDSAHFLGKDNCSIRLLKELCLDDEMKSYFPEGENDSLIQALDECQNRLNNTVPKYIRNKQIAHHDFEQIVNGKIQEVSFNSIIVNVNATIDVISEISRRITIADFSWAFFDYEQLKAKYKSSIISLIGGSLEQD